MDKFQELLILIRSFLTYGSTGVPKVNTEDTGVKLEISRINDTLQEGAVISQTVLPATPTELAANHQILSAGTTQIPSGKLYIECITSADFTGSIGGLSIPALAVKTYPPIIGGVYPAIDIIVTTGNVYLTTINV